MAKKPFKAYKQKEYKPQHYDPTKGIEPNVNFLNEGEKPYIKVPDKDGLDSKREKKDI